MNPDRLAELEEERHFLLRSLADLEREHDAGDIDEVDYQALRDGYTVRAAATLRAVDEGRAALPARTPANWPRRVGVGALVVGMIAVVWWALSASSAQRLPGDEITGFNPNDQQVGLLAEARVIQTTQPAAAAELYELVLAEDPTNVEALAYRGWTLTLSMVGETDGEVITSTLRESVDLLATAIDIDPDYPDSYCFLGIVQGRFLGEAEASLPFLDSCLERNPPADIRGLVEAFRASMQDAAGVNVDESSSDDG